MSFISWLLIKTLRPSWRSFCVIDNAIHIAIIISSSPPSGTIPYKRRLKTIVYIIGASYTDEYRQTRMESSSHIVSLCICSQGLIEDKRTGFGGAHSILGLFRLFVKYSWIEKLLHNIARQGEGTHSWIYSWFCLPHTTRNWFHPICHEIYTQYTTIFAKIF